MSLKESIELGKCQNGLLEGRITTSFPSIGRGSDKGVICLACLFFFYVSSAITDAFPRHLNKS